MVTFQISYKVYRSFTKSTLCINMLYIWNPFTEHGNISNIILGLQVALKVYIVHKYGINI